MRWILVVLAVALGAAVPSGQAPTYDTVLIGGRLVDGTGAPWVRTDLAITGDRIAAIGDLSKATAKTRVDVTGLVVAPGFIDMLGQSEDFILVDGRAASKITQGITTEITGEGKSIAPVNARMIAAAKASWDHYGIVLDFTTLAGYFERLEQRSKPAINIGTFVGAGGVRDYVIGRVNRPATADDLAAMETLVEQAMQEGALGLSTSLQYVPDRFATTEEIIALAKVARRHGGIYISHQRSESGQI
ncbi:MAG: D-aminoacylase, partial [Vicinamibacteria bacterium]|nr:D-aminoacylase [Vicinamibacteria bacterium]